MSEAFKKTSLKEKTGLVDLMAREREKAQAVQCLKGCLFPEWEGSCPYLYARGKDCQYYGLNNEEENDEHNND
jgi:hypothetical protein